MEFKKRHLLLIAFAILPFLYLIHFDDYCFGVAELLIIAGLTIVFCIAFLVISFYDLYSLSIKKLRFNFLPLSIVVIFSISLFIGIKYEGKFLFKNQAKVFYNSIDEDNSSTLILYTNKTFEYKEATKNETCTKIGTYQFKNDSLFLNKKNINDSYDNIYFFNEKVLIPKNATFSKLKLK